MRANSAGTEMLCLPFVRKGERMLDGSTQKNKFN